MEDLPNKILNYLTDFWKAPFKAMKDAANEKKYIPGLIILLISFLFLLGNLMISKGQMESSLSSGSTQAMANSMLGGMMGGINISPAIAFSGIPMPTIISQVLFALGILILPLLGIVFVTKMILKTIKEEHLRFGEVFKALSIPYGLVIIFAMVFSMLSNAIISTGSLEGQAGIFLIGILLLLGFLKTFVGIFAYVLYSMVLKEKYGTSLAASLGVVIAAVLVVMLVIIPFLMTAAALSGMTAGGAGGLTGSTPPM